MCVCGAPCPPLGSGLLPVHEGLQELSVIAFQPRLTRSAGRQPRVPASGARGQLRAVRALTAPPGQPRGPCAPHSPRGGASGAPPGRDASARRPAAFSRSLRAALGTERAGCSLMFNSDRNLGAPSACAARGSRAGSAARRPPACAPAAQAQFRGDGRP